MPKVKFNGPTEEEIDAALECIVKWECLRNFPRTEKGLLGLAEKMASMCDPARFEWLSRKVMNNEHECPTPRRLRYLCTYGKDAEPPRDGIEVDGE
jgi:hypothetical protein